jgi:hypothetical protein
MFAGHFLRVILGSWSLGRRMYPMFNPFSMLNQSEIIQSGAFLGGKAEKCETNSAALKRGVREETDAYIIVREMVMDPVNHF